MKAARKLITIALAAGSLFFLGWLVLRFFLPATLPFWLGLAIAALLRPVSLLFSQKLHLRRRRAAAFVMTLFYLLLGLLLWLALLLLWSWLSSLTARAPQLYRTVFLPAIADFFEWLSRFLSRFSPDLAQTVALWRQSFFTAAAQLSAFLSSSLLKFCTSFAACMPHFFFSVVVTILCSNFISLDYPRVTQFLLRLLPPSLRSLACEMKQFLLSTLFCMVRAYLILMAVTFSVLSFGLWLLSVQSFFPIALLTSLLDLLPVIGIGFVLLPWAVFSLFQGNRLLGFGLLLLYLAINLLRSLLEPKLVGKSIGLPPLVTLLSIYAGLQLFGIAGGLLMPTLVLVGIFFSQKYRQIKKEGEL